MSEETKQTEPKAPLRDNEEVVVDKEPPQSPNTKAAEKKLKEMSRKAKERGKPQSTSKRSEAVIKLNQNWFLGGLGISAIIAMGYFIYKSRGAISEPPPELQPYHYPPPERKESEATPSSEKANSFDLNSF